MVKNLKPILAVVVFALAFVSCENANNRQIPKPIRKLITEQKGNCLTSVEKYHYQGKEVYLFESSSCADYPVVVYDENGDVICMPSGGLSGAGDEKCPCFYDEATDKEDVWKK
jgi:hypothetical protein